jgi:lipase maturation factor 1
MQLPTLCWISSSDAFLQFLCAGGAVLSCVVALGFMPAPGLFLLWLFYLSLVKAGQVFLGFQWDTLLLETGFLAVFFAPLQWRLRPALWMPVRPARPGAQRSQEPDPLPHVDQLTLAQKSAAGAASIPRPSRLMLFLLRWLLFRLMFLSGWVKLAGGDPTWRGFTAMRYHYMTQPLPTWTSWYMNLAPNWFQAASVAGVFLIEGLIPLLFFAPRRLRLFACAMTVFLQVLIAATGNFGFFNLLAIVLCIPLLDDAALLRLRGRHRSAQAPLATQETRRWPIWATGALAAMVIPISLAPAMGRLGLAEWLPQPLIEAYRLASPFESVNAYGLFASMTTVRWELIVEGSDDGTNWKAYEFPWKPGDVRRRPQFCFPYMPRLDWQMWFAAISVQQGQGADEWLVNFARRLGEGSPPVLRLMAFNPFPNHPPRYVRFVVYDYRFTTPAERAQSGAWWQRKRLGVLGPVSGSEARE